MRSKVAFLYYLMVIVVSFDLISLPLQADSFPSGGRLTPRRFGVWNSAGGACPRPYKASPGGISNLVDYTPSGTFGATSPYTPGGIAPPGDLPAHLIQKRKNYARKDHLCPGLF